MRIGILTHLVSNFGAFLQAYALQEKVREMFPKDEVYIINFINLKHIIVNTGGWYRINKNHESLSGWLQKIRLPHMFNQARRQYFRLTKPCFSARGINRLALDCILVGSDEVWNYQDKKGNAKVKFGCGLHCNNLVAYAPSVGNSNPTFGVPTYIREGLKHFHVLSARDDLTQAFVKEVTGHSTVRVLDPTFLTVFPSAPRVVPYKPYILFYYCDHLPKEYLDQIVSYARNNGYAIYGAGECNKLYDALTVDLHPFEWVQMFRDAQIVFTGTFHGVVFSVLNEKQFLCYLTNSSRINKVGALLRELGLCDRIITKPFALEDILKHKILYDDINQAITQKRADSIIFLKESIGEHADV